MSFKTVVGQQIETFKARFGYQNLVGIERDRFDHQVDFLRSFALALVQSVGEELIENPEPAIFLKATRRITNPGYMIRNEFRVKQRTTLTRLQKELEEKA